MNSSFEMSNFVNALYSNQYDEISDGEISDDDISDDEIPGFAEMTKFPPILVSTTPREF